MQLGNMLILTVPCMSTVQRKSFTIFNYRNISFFVCEANISWHSKLKLLGNSLNRNTCTMRQSRSTSFFVNFQNNPVIKCFVRLEGLKTEMCSRTDGMTFLFSDVVKGTSWEVSSRIWLEEYRVHNSFR